LPSVAKTRQLGDVRAAIMMSKKMQQTG
jgi:hypothetical protein